MSFYKINDKKQKFRSSWEEACLDWVRKEYPTKYVELEPIKIQLLPAFEFDNKQVGETNYIPDIVVWEDAEKTQIKALYEVKGFKGNQNVYFKERLLQLKLLKYYGEQVEYKMIEYIDGQVVPFGTRNKIKTDNRAKTRAIIKMVADEIGRVSTLKQDKNRQDAWERSVNYIYEYGKKMWSYRGSAPNTLWTNRLTLIREFRDHIRSKKPTMNDWLESRK